MKPWRVIPLTLAGLLLLLSAMLSDYQNRTRRTALTLSAVVVPEKFGYFGGVLHFDTLEIKPQGVLMRKHGLFRNRALDLPYRQVNSVMLGRFLGQKFIAVDYYEGWVRGKYRIYVNIPDKDTTIVQELIASGVRLEDHWNGP